jgi:MbtH protein
MINVWFPREARRKGIVVDAVVDARTWRVVINNEEQYSIWFADRELPPGWRAEGTEGSREECLEHIGLVWSDMRPRSLRDYLAGEDAN